MQYESKLSVALGCKSMLKETVRVLQFTVKLLGIAVAAIRAKYLKYGL